MSLPVSLIIARAVGSPADERAAEAKIHKLSEPDEADLQNYRDAIVGTYLQAFDAKPDRVAVVVLPWAAALDDEDGDFDADEEV